MSTYAYIDTSLWIYPDYSKVSPNTPIDDLFGEDGCITVFVNKAEYNNVKLGVEAMDKMAIMRDNLR